MILDSMMKIQTKIFLQKLQGLFEIFLLLFLAGFFGMYNYQWHCVDFYPG